MRKVAIKRFIGVFRNHFECKIPTFVLLLSLFRVTTTLNEPVERLNDIIRCEYVEDVIMEIFKWLILKNVIVQQHTVSKI